MFFLAGGDIVINKRIDTCIYIYIKCINTYIYIYIYTHIHAYTGFRPNLNSLAFGTERSSEAATGTSRGPSAGWRSPEGATHVDR